MSVRYRVLLAAAAAAFAVGPGAPGAVLGAEAGPEEHTGISGEAAAEILERARLATMEENFTG
ncbi:MAG: hypothetical protein ACRDY7_11315, partial [Acidimicrobiia bacterium]